MGTGNTKPPAKLSILYPSWCSKITFGDPVLGLDLNSSHILYSTGFGQLTIYNITYNTILTIKETSEECITNVLLPGENRVYFAVGDAYCCSLPAPFSYMTPRSTLYNPIHLDGECSQNIRFLTEKACIIVSTKGKDIVQLDLVKSRTTMYSPIPQHAVPLDCYLEELLIVQYQHGGTRNFSKYNYTTEKVERIFSTVRSAGHISSARLCRDGVVFINNYRNLLLFRYTHDECSIYESTEKIITYSLYEDTSVWCALVTFFGNAKVFRDWNLIFEANLDLDVESFALDYPYQLAFHPPNLALSSDSTLYFYQFPFLN